MPPPVLPPPLLAAIAAQDARPVPAGVRALAEAARQRFDGRCAAILFHGSCLRRGTEEGLVDLYLLTTGGARRRPLLPDVFYLETQQAGRFLRAKLSRLPLAAFERGTAQWFHSYLWARFAQPSRLLYAADEATAARLRAARARAILTFVARTLPQMPSPFTARTLWRTGLRLTYRAELRAETSDRADRLVAADAAYYEQVTPPALAALAEPGVAPAAGSGRFQLQLSRRRRWANRLGWRLRRLQGLALSVLRLAKAGFTFQGGCAYLLWKIERHAGGQTGAPLRRHCPLALGVAIWRLWRRRA